MDDRLRILVVDGDDVDRGKVRRALEESGVGMEIIESRDAAGAVAAMKSATGRRGPGGAGGGTGGAAGAGAGGGGSAFDCILLDYHLPDMNGRAALRAMRRADPSVPVILLTRAGDEQLAVDMMKVGAADSLSKQRLGADLLSHAVRHAVRLRRAQVEADRARVLSIETEQRFRLMADAAPVLLWVTDEQSRGIYFNQGWLEFTGRTLEQELGLGWAEAIHDEDRERVVSAFRAHAAAREKFQIEFRLRRQDGEYCWVLDTAAPRFLSDGTFAGYVGSCVEITERKAAEQERAELVARERRAAAASRFLAEASVVLSSSLDYETTLASVTKLAVPEIADFCAVDMPGPDGRVRRLAAACGDERRGAMARELAERYPVRLDDPAPHGVASVLRTGRPELHSDVTDALLQAASKDPEQLRMFRELGMVSGLIAPLTARGRTLGAITLITAESGRRLTTYDLALAEDLAGRAATAVDNARLYREARDAFSSKERTMALLDTVLAAAPVGFAFFDSHLRFVRLNGAMASYNDLPPEAHFGKRPSQVNPRLGEKVEPNLRRVLETQKPVLDVELHGGEAAKPGDRREFLASYYPVRSLAGELLGVGAVLADITDRKRSEQRLLEETRTTEALYRITQRLAAELDVAKLTQTVTDEATALTGAGFGAFFYNVLDEKGEHYTLFALSGAPREAFTKFPMPQNTELFGSTFRGEGIVRCDDITKDPRYGRNEPNRPDVSGFGRLPVRSYLAAPVVSRGGDVIGGLFFGHEQAGVFNERDERLVAGIAAQAAVAMDNARLYEALRGSERQHRFLAESIPQIVWTATPDGSVDYHNQRWHQYTGLTPEQSTGLAWKRTVHPDDLQNCIDRWRRSVETGETFEVEYRLRRASDGAFRWQLGRAEPLRDAAGNIVKWFGTSTDIHDRKESEQELKAAKEAAERSAEAAEAANAAKDQFLAVLSHELRTPLTPVLTTVQALESEPDLPRDLRAPLEMIKRNVELEARLIDDLLDLTRIAKNKLELHLQTVDVNQALESAVEICRGEIEEKGLRLEVELCAARRHVRADAARMHQIFWNLIKNAVKFTPEGGVITVRTVHVEGGEVGRWRSGEVESAAMSSTSPPPHVATSPHLLIEVRDTGIGIEADVLPRIFDAFEQGERSITRRFGGLGLGLAISRALIDMQGGRLTAASEGKGRGAVFAIEMPTVEPPVERPEATPGPVGAAAFGAAEKDSNGEVAASSAAAGPGAGACAGLRILLVEDHDDTAKAMRNLLRRRGFDVAIATTVAEALDAFGRERFDLLISDIGLRDASGLDLMRQIRAKGGTTADCPTVTAIALSGFGMEEDVARSREAGFFAHLTKPINWDLLEATILRAVGARGGNGERGIGD